VVVDETNGPTVVPHWAGNTDNGAGVDPIGKTINVITTSK